MALIVSPARRVNVKTRKIVNLRDKPIRLLSIPLPERLHGTAVAECALRDLIVGGGDVANQGVFQVLPGAKAAVGRHLGDAAVEAFHHPVGLEGCAA